MNKEQRLKMSEETLDILNNGKYSLNGKSINIKKDIDIGILESKLYGLDSDISLSNKENKNTEIYLMNIETLKAGKILKNKYSNVAILNFASGKNAGGGFLKGTMAQEESITYSSSLYLSLKKFQYIYDENRKNKTAFYSDNMFYSPNIVVFRDENYKLINPYKLNVISSASPNKRAILENEKNKINEIYPTLKRRIYKILQITQENNQDALVLGAYGCGVFFNDPEMVAEIFYEYLNNDFKNVFKEIIFAIYDKNDSENIKIFKKYFNFVEQ